MLNKQAVLKAQITQNYNCAAHNLNLSDKKTNLQTAYLHRLVDEPIVVLTLNSVSTRNLPLVKRSWND